MSKIQQALQQAAAHFAAEVVTLLREATLQEILAISGKVDPEPPARRAGRPARAAATSAPHVTAVVAKPNGVRTRGGGKKRSPGEVVKLGERVHQYLSSSGAELNVTALADALHVSTADLALPLRRLRGDEKIQTRGQKRSTTYRAN